MSYEETAVVIQEDTEQLNSMEKCDQYVSLCSFYRLNCCERGDNYTNCNFVINIRYVYVESLIGGSGIDNLQNYCRKYLGSFFSLKTFLKSLASTELEKIKLEKKFCEVIKI